MVLNSHFLINKAEYIIKDTDRWRKYLSIINYGTLMCMQYLEEIARYRKPRCASCCLSLNKIHDSYHSLEIIFFICQNLINTL